VDDEALCTLDELTGLVETALSVDYPGAPTGRVRDVPDQRAIRWYVTRGLVDRPVASRGRVALYGRRHLLQLVAIKRRQAEGASLAEIQAELAGATDEALARVARLTEPLPEPRDRRTVVAPLPRPTRFWADRPQNRVDGPFARLDRPYGTSTRDGAAAPAEPAAAATPAAAAPTAATSAAATPAATATPAAATPAAAAPAAAPAAETVALHGIRLAPGVTLLIEDGAAQATDLAAIRAAARPLLNLLAGGGQVDTEE